MSIIIVLEKTKFSYPSNGDANTYPLSYGNDLTPFLIKRTGSLEREIPVDQEDWKSYSTLNYVKPATHDVESCVCREDETHDRTQRTPSDDGPGLFSPHLFVVPGS